MDPDLMGAAGMVLQLEQVGGAETGKRVDIGTSGAAVAANRHPLAIGRMPRQWCLHGPLLVEMSPGQRPIGPLDSAGGEHRAEAAVTEVVLGHHPQATGVPV